MTAQTEQSPSWFHNNSRFLMLLSIVLLGGGSVGWYLPRAAEQSRQASWDLYFQFENALQDADSSSAMLTALLPLQGDDRSYPWALSRAAGWAAERKDNEALQAVQAKIGEIDPAATKVRVLEDGEPVDLLTSLAARIGGLDELSKLEPLAIEPTGPTLELALTDSSGKTYALSYKLYSEQAPATTTQILQLIESGAFEEATALPSGQNGLQLDGLGSEDQEPLRVERAWGCFHASGTLCTVLQNGGEPGQQHPSKLQLLGADLYGQDGVTTVVGKLVDGEDAFTELAALGRAADQPNQFESELKITAKLKQ